MPIGRAEVALISLSTFLAAAGAELVLRIAAPLPDPFSAWRRRPQPYTPSAHPRGARIEVAVEPGLNGLAASAVFTTNDLGFRGPPLVTPKPKDERRIFLLGGSTAECLVLSDADAFGAQIELALGGGFRVQNAGRSGDTSSDHLAMLGARIVHLEPDRVLVFAGFNDLVFTAIRPDPLHFGPDEELDRGELFRMAAAGLQIVRRYYLIRHPEQFMRLALESGGTIETNYRFGADLCGKTPAVEGAPATDLEAYARNLRSIAGLANAHPVKLAFVTQVSTWDLPDGERFGIVQWMTCLRGKRYSPRVLAELLERYNEVTRTVAAESGAQLIDLARELPKTAEYFYDDCHFNAKGSQAAAAIVARALIE